MANKPRRNPKSKFSGNHQRSWLWGLHAVTETLDNGVWPVVEMFVNQQAYDRFEELLQAKESLGVPLAIVDNHRLEQLSQAKDHQGLVIRLGKFPYQTIESFESSLDKAMNTYAVASMPKNTDSRPPLIVICDRLQDSFNFGAVLRCCDGANVLAVIVGKDNQAEVTPHVVRSSSGAVTNIPIVQVADLVSSAQFMKDRKLHLVAADSNSQMTPWNAKFGAATALIIGSEAHGIQADLLSLCDQRVCIPMLGKVSSLNAAVAAGILLYEIRRQQSSQVDSARSQPSQNESPC